ncbi:hypothetical protein AOT82_491 [Psychrobacter sp. AntiMn-1]|nr:hypothetical protein AOT82_491 [Psychrobacter sp. AntiMn-1]
MGYRHNHSPRYDEIKKRPLFQFVDKKIYIDISFNITQ